MENYLTVSTVTPVYCGAAYLDELITEIEKVKSEWEQKSFPVRLQESIFVVDSAKDHSLQVLKKWTCKPGYEWVRVIELSKNFGQHPATMCGVLYSSGDWIVTLDEDLQHKPNQFIELFQAMRAQSYDIVYAKPKAHVHKSLIRDFTSRTFKKIISKMTKNPFVTDYNSFRLMRGAIARAAASVCAHETYFDVAVGWFTDKITKTEMLLEDHRYINNKSSGYSFHGLLSHARRLVVSSQTKILRYGAWIGLASIILAIGLGIHFFYLKLMKPEAIPVQGWTSLILSILFMGGLTATLLSIILEFLGGISLQTQGKPVFFTVDRSSDQIIQTFFAQKNDKS